MNPSEEKTELRTEVFSSGGGTQSSAIAALIVQGRLPKPDVAVIVDTEKERSSTWEYLSSVVAPALSAVGVTIHRITKSEFAKETVWDLQQKHLLIPAFSNQTGEAGKLSGYCSDKWKTRVRNRWLRKHYGLKRKQFRVWVGFSLDEMPRAARMMRGTEWQLGLIRFPLINDVPMRREQSIELVRSMGWPTPPRSNCWMCPNQGDAEWVDLKTNYPEEFERACALEREIQQHDPFAWLHKACVPLDQVQFREDENFTRPCSSGGCFL